MSGNEIGFILWCACGLLFIIVGICDVRSKKEVPFSFWANAKAPEVTDIKAYNKAVGKLFIVFGIIFNILGIPLLAGQNRPYILVSVIGTMFLSIAAMVIYSIKIEAKYKKK